MRINELLTESETQHLEEGPILNKIGSAVGNAARGVANTVGAVAGGVAGAGQALKKGYQTGKAFVGNEPAAAGAAPTGGTTPPSTQNINKQGPAGTAPAVAQTGAAAQALAKTTAAVGNQSPAKAGQTVYAQVKANINNLDKKGKQRILQLLQKSIAVPDPKPAAPAAATPPATPPETAPVAEPVAATTPAAEPATTTAQAEPVATTTKARGGKVAGQVSQTPDAIRKRNARRDKANAAATTGGAGAFNQMAQQATQQNASKINYGNALSEALAQRVEMHKQKMFETGLSNGTTSVFRK
jgi:hypothetical protein